MPQKLKIELGEVQKTLLIPLYGRAREYESPNPLVKDRFARDIVDRLAYDFDAVFSKIPPQFVINGAVRAHHMDNVIVSVLERHPDATVVNIGAGLDTTFQRLDNGRMFWYDLDLPDSIALRRQLVPEGERNKCIAGSVLDTKWFTGIQKRGSKVLFMASGVLVYLEETEVRRLFLELIREFPGSEIVFESYSTWMLRVRNRALFRKNNKQELLSPMRWGVNTAREIARWSDRIRIIDEFPFYSRIDLNAHWNEKALTPIKIMNFFRIMKIMRLGLG